MTKPLISASILSANLAHLGKDVDNVLAAGAHWVHIDVMDNHFVPNLSFGPQVCQTLRQHGIQAPLDVHLMITPVDNMVTAFAKAGATSITFHPEATENTQQTIATIKQQQCKVGLALKPHTPITTLSPFLDNLDLILVMSVEPGFAGQTFIEATLDRIQQIKRLIDSRPIAIAVDGGVNADNAAAIVNAGADILVAGSAIFNANDYQVAIKKLR